MSIRFTDIPTAPHTSDPEALDTEAGDVSTDDDDDNQTWDDWVEPVAESRLCLSLFDDNTFSSVDGVLAYDKATYGFDIRETSARLSLDSHQQIRLINYIRKNKPSAAALASLSGAEGFFAQDEYLRPVVEDDPILLADLRDWTDSDSDPGVPDPTLDIGRRVRKLEEKLKTSRKEFIDYRASVRLSALQVFGDPNASTPIVPPARDDDSHYFQSYEEKDIHAIMIQDQVRTSSYASFILENPLLFQDAIVLDVGCGTGILSLLAARGGAKRVIAVDASDIADKAKRIVKANKVDDVVTVIKGKIEEITLPDDITQVDIIVSEWMGYALLYESMLDSVLSARDRFLRPDGVMAPSQCKLMLGLCDASEIVKERVEFWNDIYGFDLSVMSHDVFDEAIVDVVGPNTLLSEPCVVKDIYVGSISLKELEFSSPFTLTSTAEKRTKLTAFIVYFDTFFTTSGQPIPSDTKVGIIKPEDPTLAEVWPVGGKRPLHRRKSSASVRSNKITSFSTGPRSIPTHWKHTLFLLREPVVVEEGTVISGTFHCRKRETNSRELEVEIHWSVMQDPEGPESRDMTVQIYKVR